MIHPFFLGGGHLHTSVVTPKKMGSSHVHHVTTQKLRLAARPPRPPARPPAPPAPRAESASGTPGSPEEGKVPQVPRVELRAAGPEIHISQEGLTSFEAFVL